MRRTIVKIPVLVFVILLTGKTVLCQSQTDNTKAENSHPAVYKNDSSLTGNTDSAALVKDYENMFSEDEKNRLLHMIDSFEKKSAITITLITIPSSATDKENFDDYVKQLLDNMHDEDAVVIGISKQYKQIRISNGNDIRQFLSNEKTKEIIENYFIPNYRNGNYFNGTSSGVYHLMNAINSYKINY